MIYWSTKRQSAAAAEDEAPASQEPAAAANGGAPEAEAAGEQQKRRGKVDMDAIVDLSGLDLSVLQRPARVPPLARVSRPGRTGGWAGGGAVSWVCHRITLCTLPVQCLPNVCPPLVCPWRRSCWAPPGGPTRRPRACRSCRSKNTSAARAGHERREPAFCVRP